MYQYGIITDMRRLNITLDDETDHLLAQHLNQAEVVREAIRMYHGGITTETLSGLRVSYKQLRRFMEEKFEYYDKVFNDLEKLIGILETRM